MTAAIQYELFESNDDMSLLRREIKQLREEVATLRRSQFARLNAMGKLIMEEKTKKEKEGKNDSIY